MAPTTRSSTKAQAQDSIEGQPLDSPLPVTVISGFLGSGKTTLLRHILSSPTHGLRIAVIVNDMAAINIDAQHVARFSSKGDDTKLVQMDNGCICCTLRGDLLTELARLAWSNAFDSVVIESSGISEPQQVAEKFTAELSEAMVVAEGMGEEDRRVLERVAKLGGLDTLARLDTMVTVVDAFRFFSEFDTPEFLMDRYGKDEVPEQDQRTISDLFAEQVEFANVIVLNKVDMVDASTLNRVRAYVKALNPHAKILESRYAKVDAGEMLKTGQFRFGDAVAMAGWLSSLHEMTVRDVNGKTRLAPVPETLEYGIGSFVYTARRPFDPLKLYRAIEGRFILLQDEYEDDEEEGEEDETEDSGDDEVEMTDTSPPLNNQESSSEPSDEVLETSSMTSHCDSDSDAPSKPHTNDSKAILSRKRADPLFSGLHRSKGAIWLATRPQHMGGWSSAGAMLTINYQAPWFCTIPEEEWGANDETIKSIMRDYVGEWGDRRQEIVFIGEGLDREGLTALFDSCLLTDGEMKRWERVIRGKSMTEEEREERLQRIWNDEYWAEWGESHDHDHASHVHGHGHQH